MEQDHRPRGRDPVQIPAHRLVGEVDGIVAPREQRCIGVLERALELDQARDQRGARAATRDPLAVRMPALVKTDIGQSPDHALGRVGVALDEAGHDHEVGEALVGGAVFSLEPGAADRQDRVAAHGNVGRRRRGCVLGQDAGGAV